MHNHVWNTFAAALVLLSGFLFSYAESAVGLIIALGGLGAVSVGSWEVLRKSQHRCQAGLREIGAMAVLMAGFVDGQL